MPSEASTQTCDVGRVCLGQVVKFTGVVVPCEELCIPAVNEAVGVVLGNGEVVQAEVEPWVERLSLLTRGRCMNGGLVANGR